MSCGLPLLGGGGGEGRSTPGNYQPLVTLNFVCYSVFIDKLQVLSTDIFY